ncbi:hypothetical protein [Rhodococcus sp. YH3-3]|uniref:hypothetical protein n=1 Tax=Rhodococcus sp. YH3-3 TaxID=1803579 RepID=UPI0007DB1340|nr:hypothetical protein [Rhodococcus sp. YH3-3]
MADDHSIGIRRRSCGFIWCQTKVLGTEIRCDIRGPEDYAAAIAHGSTNVESWYAEAGVDFTRQVIDGRMGYIGTVRDDVEFVAGRPSISLREWAIENRDRLAAGSTT